MAIGSFACAWSLRLALGDRLGGTVPYLFFYPAIMVSAWFGGFGPGLLATILSAVSAMQWLLPPEGLSVGSRSDQVGVTAFAAIGVFVSWLNGRLRGVERRHREAAREATVRAERLDAILNTTVDAIIVIDARGTVESFNRGAERLFGYDESEVVGQNVRILMPSPDRDRHHEYVANYLATGEAHVIGVGRQVTARRRDGTLFPVHLSVGEMLIDGRRKFTGMLHDLTARARLESQLREQAALTKLGEMAAVLAHEINNPLAGIRGAIQVMSNRTAKDGGNTDVLREIIARIDALDRMMKDLLLYARPPTPKPVLTALVPLLSTTADLLTGDPSLHGVHIEVEGDAPPVPADPDMLRIVFQNLIINGAHAMNGQGRIRVVVGAAGQACRVSIVDEGPGIPPDLRDKIFAPFFTTKRKGTGLGLATVKRLVEAHHGRIAIECPPAGGTAVLVDLPFGAA